jgi:hypothetical protein
MQVPEPGGRIRVESRPRQEEETMSEHQAHAREPDEPTTVGEAADLRRARVAELLDERTQGSSDKSERVAYLFPRPETTEWNVRELSYDRRRRAQIRAS